MSARDELIELVLPILEKCFDSDWNMTYSEMVTDSILAAGYSKPRTITEVVGANVLPYESVIRTRQGYAMEKLSDGWYRAGVDYAYTPNPNWLPATVIYTPKES